MAVFDEDGNFAATLIPGSNLAAPWGVALAPAGFGRFGNDLLVGNFSFLHSEINAFDPTTGALRGTIPIDDGGNRPGGLWALNFGIGGSNGDPNTLYFTDGMAGETHGLFAALTQRLSRPAWPCWRRRSASFAVRRSRVRDVRGRSAGSIRRRRS